MLAPEGFERVPCGIHTTFGNILTSLPDALVSVCLCHNVQQSLISFRVLHDGSSLTINRQNDGAFRSFKLPKKRGGVVAKSGQRLNVFSNVHPVMLPK